MDRGSGFLFTSRRQVGRLIHKCFLSLVLSLLLIPVVGINGQTAPIASRPASQATIVRGSVVTNGDKAQPGAIVYLKNRATEAVKGSISAADGSYRFDTLSTESEYQLWAEYKGKRSPTIIVNLVKPNGPADYVLKLDRSIADFLIPFGR